MGLLTEVFRRMPGVVRSLSPTHPLLAWGRDAEAFVVGHDKATVPFGDESPFGRLLDRRAKILVFDGPFSVITFTHFVEARIAPSLGFPLFEDRPSVGHVVDRDGVLQEVAVEVLSDVANRLRREERLVARLEQDSILRKSRLGRIPLLFIECRAFVASAEAMVAGGESFFDVPVSARVNVEQTVRTVRG